MSMPALNWALSVRCPGPGAKLVLLCLANRATPQDLAWPGFDLLAHETQLSRRSVIRKIAALEAAGLISSVKRIQPGGQITNQYRLHRTGVTGCHPGRGANLSKPGCQPDTQTQREPIPLPPGWRPNRDDVAELQHRYPELDINASTERFIDINTRKGTRQIDWDQRYRSWLSEDAEDRAHTRRAKRTAARPARSDQRSDRNRRRKDEALARIAALSNDPSPGDGP